jgi:hypothetical protein
MLLIYRLLTLMAVIFLPTLHAKSMRRTPDWIGSRASKTI